MTKVRVGIIGLGSWGVSHLEAFQSLPHVEVVAVCDQRPERLQALADKTGSATCYEHAHAVCERNDIDLVSVVTFEHDHLAPVLGALRAGKHVLVEKPVATTIDEARKMQAVATEQGRFLMPGHLLRFDPRYAGIYQSIHNDQIGAPVSIHLKRSRQKSLYTTYQRTHTVYELMVHDIDLALWYAGSRVTAVKAYERSLQGGKTPELLWACLEFENGTVAMLHSNWLMPDEAGIAIADAAEVIGKTGIASFETTNAGLQIWDRSGRSTPDFAIHSHVAGQVVGALREQLSYICSCVMQHENPNYLSFDDAIHGIQVAAAIMQSAETRAEVKL